MNITVPLQIVKGKILTDDDVKTSIDRNIDRLLQTAKGSVITDPAFGFSFSALRFENFNEYEGVVQGNDDDDPVYQKKISGSSRNLQTFASELNETIQKYEKRLKDISTVMTYLRGKKEINIAVRATYVRKEEVYEYSTVLRVWN